MTSDGPISVAVEDRSSPGPSAVSTAFRIGVVLLAVFVLGGLLVRLEDTIGLVLLAATIAVTTDRMQRALSRRLGRAASYVMTALITFVFIVVAAAIIWNDLAQQAERLNTLVADRIAGLTDGSLPDRLARLTRAEDSIAAVLDRLPSTVVAGEDSTVGVGGKVVNLLVVVVLAAFLQAGAGSALDWIVARWSRDDRASVRELIADTRQRAAGLTRRSLLLALTASVIVSVVAHGLGIPGATVLGVWAGSWLVVPTVGALVGSAPIVLVAWLSSPPTGLAMFGAVVLISVAARSARRRYVDSVLRLPSALWVVAIGVGTLIAGPGGVVVMVLVTALACAWLAQDAALPRPERPSTRRAQVFEIRDSNVHVLPSAQSVMEVIAGGLAVVGLAVAVNSVSRAIVWIVVASMIAVALDRPASFIERHARLGRSGAVAVVISVGVVLAVVVTLLGALNASSTTSEFSNDLPVILRDLETAPLVGNWLADHDAAVWLDQQLQDLPQRLAARGDVADYLPVVGNRVLDLLWTLLLAASLLIDGPRLAAALRRRVPAHRRRQTIRLTTVSLEAVSAYLGGAMVIAAINASVVLVVAISLGLALAPVLAAWAFIWNFVPQIGGFMGGFPLVVLALTAGPAQALVAAIVFVGYQFIENHVIQPKIIGDAIDVPPWVTLLAALSGGAMAGLLGAVVLTPLIGVVHLTVQAARRQDFPGRVAESIGAAFDDRRVALPDQSC